MTKTSMPSLTWVDSGRLHVYAPPPGNGIGRLQRRKTVLLDEHSVNITLKVAIIESRWRSQINFSRYLSMQESRLSHIVNGAPATPIERAAIAHALGKTRVELFGE